jgi:hypothetical protein
MIEHVVEEGVVDLVDIRCLIVLDDGGERMVVGPVILGHGKPGLTIAAALTSVRPAIVVVRHLHLTDAVAELDEAEPRDELLVAGASGRRGVRVAVQAGVHVLALLDRTREHQIAKVLDLLRIRGRDQ